MCHPPLQKQSVKGAEVPQERLEFGADPPAAFTPSLRMRPPQRPPVQQPQVPRISLSLLDVVCEPLRVDPLSLLLRQTHLLPVASVNVQGTSRFPPQMLPLWRSRGSARAGPPSPPLHLQQEPPAPSPADQIGNCSQHSSA